MTKEGGPTQTAEARSSSNGDHSGSNTNPLGGLQDHVSTTNVPQGGRRSRWEADQASQAAPPTSAPAQHPSIKQAPTPPPARAASPSPANANPTTISAPPVLGAAPSSTTTASGEGTALASAAYGSLSTSGTNAPTASTAGYPQMHMQHQQAYGNWQHPLQHPQGQQDYYHQYYQQQQMVRPRKRISVESAATFFSSSLSHDAIPPFLFTSLSSSTSSTTPRRNKRLPTPLPCLLLLPQRPLRPLPRYLLKSRTMWRRAINPCTTPRPSTGIFGTRRPIRSRGRNL